MRCHIDFETGKRECFRTGGIPMCQLCPDSPDHWEADSTPPSTTPWDGRPVAGRPHDSPSPDSRPDFAGGLNWSSGGPAGAAPRCNPPRPCKGCGLPSGTLSPGKLVPYHKTCAEDWHRAHPHATQTGPATL